MRRTLVAALAVAVAGLATVSTASAQQGRGMMRGMGAMAGLNILRSDEAKTELKLTDAQTEKVTSMMEEMRSSMMERFQSLQDVPEDEREAKSAAMMKELGSDVTKQVKEILDAEQFARYHQISLQSMGIDAFMQDEVAEKLKISDEQKKKLEELADDMRQESMAIFQDSQGDREGAMKKIGDLRKSSMEKVMGAMTDEQKAAWTEMIGKPFTMPAFGGGGRRRPQG